MGDIKIVLIIIAFIILGTIQYTLSLILKEIREIRAALLLKKFREDSREWDR